MRESLEQLGVLIRPLRPDDAGLLVAFFLTLGPRSRWWFHPHPFDRQTAVRLVSQIGTADERRYLMVRLCSGHEEVVGYGFLVDLAADMPELGIAIADHTQGRGLGQHMMQHLIAVGRQLGKRGIRLTVYDDNHGARHVYEQAGFTTQRIAHHMELVFQDQRRHGSTIRPDQSCEGV
jgi:ribosomal protein S18 acetylase RimI-like enzyme